MPLPRCFFDISINGIPTGRIVFELFTDVCPKTCENFRCLCTGEKGEGKTTFKPLHYKGTPIHRVVKGFIVQGGDFENGDGSGGESIYGGLFKDENFKWKHDTPFLLSMANKGPNTNGSQYFITTKPAPHLDGIHVVFGRVVSGDQFVTEIENQKVDSKSRPYADVRVINSGELVLMKKGKIVGRKAEKTKVTSSSESDEEASSSSSESGSSSEDEREQRRRKERRRRRRKQKFEKRRQQGKGDKKNRKRQKKSSKKKRKKRESSSDSENSSGSNSGAESIQDTVVSSTIQEEELPPEISSSAKRSWLYRHSKSPSPLEGEKKRKKRREESKDKRVGTSPSTGSQKMSNSGRVLKGRGFMRYKTPPPRGNDSYRESRRGEYQWPRRKNWDHQRSPIRSCQDRADNRRSYRDRSEDRRSYQDRSEDRRPYRDRSEDRHSYQGRSEDRRSYQDRSEDRRPYRDRSEDRHPNRDKSPLERIRYHSRSPVDQHRPHHQSPIDRKRSKRDSSLSHSRSRSRDRQGSRRRRDSSREHQEKDEHGVPPTSPHEKEEITNKEGGHPSFPQTYQKVKNDVSPEPSHEGDGRRRRSKWDRHVSRGNTPSSEEEDQELEKAYQKVEQTLAQQQFGINALIDETLK